MARRRRRAPSRRAGGLGGVVRAVRRYFPVTQHTSVERVVGALFAVVAVLVLAFMAWVMLRR